ncbi:N-acetyltransferase 8 [Cynocephalus volans]|uniref:N-acetyltransferase 8 n=1 Tax=Cynocephalus volans TaxID=110931 RepID=UPI002FCC2EAF
MASFHIRKYRESDRKWVLDLFSQGILEQVPTTFCHLLKLPRTLVLIGGGPISLVLVSGSWLLALTATLTLLAVLWFLARYPWKQYEVLSLCTDMSDVTKSYLSEHGSCFWVAESEEQVVGIVGARPAGEPTSQKKQLELLHLCVAFEHRHQGIAKALVRTVLQFARTRGYNEVVLVTCILQQSALAIYQGLGFQKTRQYYSSLSMRLVAAPLIDLVCHLPCDQGGGL